MIWIHLSCNEEIIPETYTFITQRVINTLIKSIPIHNLLSCRSLLNAITEDIFGVQLSWP